MITHSSVGLWSRRHVYFSSYYLQKSIPLQNTHEDLESKMARILFSVLILILFLSTTGHSYIRDYSKVKHKWTSQESSAYISGRAKFEDGTEVINLFVVDFDKSRECNPVFKIAFMDNYEYGEVEKTVPMEAGTIKLYVDNKLIYDGPIVNIIYSNGIEFGAAISPEGQASLSSGEYLTVELVDKMDILFNLNNAKKNIDSAQKSCSQGLTTE
jgi:hypothetical protein